MDNRDGFSGITLWLRSAYDCDSVEGKVAYGEPDVFDPEVTCP